MNVEKLRRQVAFAVWDSKHVIFEQKCRHVVDAEGAHKHVACGLKVIQVRLFSRQLTERLRQPLVELSRAMLAIGLHCPSADACLELVLHQTHPTAACPTGGAEIAGRSKYLVSELMCRHLAYTDDTLEQVAHETVRPTNHMGRAVAKILIPSKNIVSLRFDHYTS